MGIELVLGNGYGVQGQNYVALLHRSKMAAQGGEEHRMMIIKGTKRWYGFKNFLIFFQSP